MKGSLYNSRKTRLLFLTLILSIVFFFSVHQTHWALQFAENKVEQFIGHRLKVKIGNISGGIFRDMILRDVLLSTGQTEKSRVFPLDRLEISYRMWDAAMDRFAVMPGKTRPARYIAMYFSEKNPFLRGFVKLYKFPGKIDMIGHVSPIIFGDYQKKGVKGVLLRREDGRYNCDVVLDGKLKIKGIVDFSNKAVDLNFLPVNDERWSVKIKGDIDKSGDIKIYSRLDRVKSEDSEITGDIWVDYTARDVSLFSVRTENLAINKKPIWDVKVRGKFIRSEKKIFVDEVNWGDRITVKAEISAKPPYPMDIDILIKALELSELGEFMNAKEGELSGRMEGEIKIAGDIKKSEAKGRVYIGEGSLGEMKFRSLFATLKGRLPVIRIVDSRVVKDWGNILVSGEMDFSRITEGKTFDELIFKTDNKVAVWEHWQISKEETLNVVEASKDNITVTTSFEGDGLTQEVYSEHLQQKDIGFKYNLGTGNSLKMELEEENDFFGVEHKIQF